MSFWATTPRAIAGGLLGLAALALLAYIGKGEVIAGLAILAGVSVSVYIGDLRHEIAQLEAELRRRQKEARS